MKSNKKSEILWFLIIFFGFISILGLYRHSIVVASGTLAKKTDVPTSPPYADAGDDFAVYSEDLPNTVIYGYANDPDSKHLVYRWREGNIELTSWQPVGSGGEVILDFSNINHLAPGRHILILEVHDGENTAIDRMMLTVDASSPSPISQPH